MPNVLAFAEARGSELRKVAFEALSAARQVADQVGGEVHAVLVGPPGIAGKAASLAGYGADLVYVCEHAGFANYAPEATAALVAERVTAGDYRAVIFSASQQGKDLAPRTAAKLQRSIATDVTSLVVAADAVTVTHPGYTGKVVQTLTLAGTPAIVSLRPGALPAVAKDGAGRTEAVAPPQDPSAGRVVVTETVLGDTKKLDLGEAPIIVSGG
ncbi:MAG: electron transfer flavoprotein subunit alpha/FixB family protein, partial [Gemmatimonadota bacterium]